MVLGKLLGKPAWESASAATRAAAVRDGTAPELLAALPDLARRDTSAAVRRAALARIDDLALLADRWRHDEDPSVRALGRERYLARLLDATGAADVAAAERALQVEQDEALLASVAREARSPVLRRRVLERPQRPGFLLERCQRDPEPAIRLWLAGRIDDASALDRLAERVRNADKRLARVARERAHALRRAAGDPTALHARALEIAAELDRLRRERPAEVRERRDALADEWQRLAPRLDVEHQRRVQGYFDALADALDPASSMRPATPAPGPAHDDATIAPSVEQSTDAAEATGRPAAVADGVAAAGRALVSSGADAATPDSVAKAERRRGADPAAIPRTATLAAIDAALSVLEQAIDAGRAADARAARAALHAHLGPAAPPLSRALSQRLTRAEAELARLERWQRWSGNKQRQRLCEDVAQLIGAGLHPDAVATRVRELETAWARLDAIEGRGAEPESGLARRFRAVCHKALAPARPYFEQRHALRSRHKVECLALLAEVDAGLGAADAGTLERWRSAVADRLRRIDELEPRARAELAPKLRGALDRLRAARDAIAASVEVEKRKLLARLRRELPRAAAGDAVALAREVQARWNALGRAPRAIEDALRGELRALLDPLFDGIRAAERSGQSERDERAREAHQLIAELDALAGGDAAALRHAAARLDAIERRWRELKVRERDAERRHEAAVARLRDALERQRRERQRLEREALWQADALLAALEAAVTGERAVDPTWPEAFAALSLGSAARQTLEPRRRRVVAWLAQSPSIATWQAEAEAALDTARALAIRAECLAGSDTPPEFQRARREYQLRRLAERLGGAPVRDIDDEASELLLAWCAIGPLPSGEREALASRLRRALAALDRRRGA